MRLRQKLHRNIEDPWSRYALLHPLRTNSGVTVLGGHYCTRTMKKVQYSISASGGQSFHQLGIDDSLLYWGNS
jgi:hypothetical protein